MVGFALLTKVGPRDASLTWFRLLGSESSLLSFHSGGHAVSTLGTWSFRSLEIMASLPYTTGSPAFPAQKAVFSLGEIDNKYAHVWQTNR